MILLTDPGITFAGLRKGVGLCKLTPDHLEEEEEQHLPRNQSNPRIFDGDDGKSHKNR